MEGLWPEGKDLFVNRINLKFFLSVCQGNDPLACLIINTTIVCPPLRMK